MLHVKFHDHLTNILWEKVSRNKYGCRSAILDPIPKSFELRQDPYGLMLHVKFHEHLTNSLWEKVSRNQFWPCFRTKMAADRPSWIQFQNRSNFVRGTIRPSHIPSFMKIRPTISEKKCLEIKVDGRRRITHQPNSSADLRSQRS